MVRKATEETGTSANQSGPTGRTTKPRRDRKKQGSQKSSLPRQKDEGAINPFASSSARNSRRAGPRDGSADGDRSQLGIVQRSPGYESRNATCHCHVQERCRRGPQTVARRRGRCASPGGRDAHPPGRRHRQHHFYVKKASAAERSWATTHAWPCRMPSNTSRPSRHSWASMFWPRFFVFLGVFLC